MTAAAPENRSPMETEGTPARTNVLRTQLPLAVAPMAGGPSTPELVVAVTKAGGFGFLAGGNRDAATLRADIEAVRAEIGDAPFGVNLFAPSPARIDRAAFADYRETILPVARELGVDLDSEPQHDDDGFDEKMALVLELRVPVISFAFGLPPAEAVARAHANRQRVFVTVTSVPEARAAQALGADALIAQGPQAGGHSSIHDLARRVPSTEQSASAMDSHWRTRDLVADIVASGDVPVIAAGGIAGPRDVAELIQAGASAVQVGTLFLLADEAGTSPLHREALQSPEFTETIVTRAFTGRPARSLCNAFARQFDAVAPTGYPEVHRLTQPLRRAATERRDAQRTNLWAGTGWREARNGPATAIVDWLVGDA